MLTTTQGRRMGPGPIASIVVATYNRARVLRYAILSVLQSSLEDWELIIIGDGCTDETEAVVASFDDPRVRFVNLPDNSGAQSVPNNAGVAMARGKYLFFLNHDDMYFADHLSRSIAFLESTGADVVFSPVALLQQSGKDAGPPDPACDVIILDGAATRGFDPRVFVIASSWAMRRETCLAVGPWLAPEATRLSPSQEWLYRAWKKRHRVAFQPYVSVLCIHAGPRRLSYVSQASEHERAWSWVAGMPCAGAELAQCIAISQAPAVQIAQELALRRARGPLKRMRDSAIDALRHLGLHPTAIRRFLDREGRGAWIAGVRAHSGELTTLAPGERLLVGEPAAERFLVSGWHGGEVSGRWTARGTAEIAFRLPASDRPVAVALAGYPLQPSAVVTFLINGEVARTHRYVDREDVVRLPLPPAAGMVLLTIKVDQVSSPDRWDAAQDQRVRGFWLSVLELEDGISAG